LTGIEIGAFKGDEIKFAAISLSTVLINISAANNMIDQCSAAQLRTMTGTGYLFQSAS